MSPLESIISSVNSCNSSNDIFKSLKLFESFTVGCPPSTKTAKEFCNKSINNLLSSFPVFHRGISIESQYLIATQYLYLYGRQENSTINY